MSDANLSASIALFGAHETAAGQRGSDEFGVLLHHHHHHHLIIVRRATCSCELSLPQLELKLKLSPSLSPSNA